MGARESGKEELRDGRIGAGGNVGEMGLGQGRCGAVGCGAGESGAGRPWAPVCISVCVCVSSGPMEMPWLMGCAV